MTIQAAQNFCTQHNAKLFLPGSHQEIFDLSLWFKEQDREVQFYWTHLEVEIGDSRSSGRFPPNMKSRSCGLTPSWIIGREELWKHALKAKIKRGLLKKIP